MAVCGRFSMTLAIDELRGLIPFEISNAVTIVEPRYNIAPGTDVLCVARRQDGLSRAGWMRWGYRLPWSSKPLVNARSESLWTKPVFRHAIQHRRCLVPADSYYEWGPAPNRIPFRILPFPYRVVWLAGIYDVTREGTPTVAIVTRAARPDIIGVHHRMPVMFQEDAGQKWLDGDNLSDLLTKPYPHTLTVYPVTKDVNSPRHQGPQLHIPLLDNPLGP